MSIKSIPYIISINIHLHYCDLYALSPTSDLLSYIPFFFTMLQWHWTKGVFLLLWLQLKFQYSNPFFPFVELFHLHDERYTHTSSLWFQSRDLFKDAHQALQLPPSCPITQFYFLCTFISVKDDIYSSLILCFCSHSIIST